MTSKRAFYAMIGGILLLIGLCVAGTYFANKLLVAEGNKLLELKTEEAVLERQSAALDRAKKDIAEYEDLEKIAKTIVPQEKDQARTVLELVKLAEESGISLTSIKFPDSLLGEAANRAAKPTNGQPIKTVDSNTTQLTPLKDLKGVYVMEIEVQSDANTPISYNQLLNYLQSLEKNRRTAQLKDLSILPSEANRNLVSFTLVINSYVRP